MEMWTWLQPWWNWWAWITCLFNWTAIGSIGTVGVLWIAVRGAQANQRFERQKAIMRLSEFVRLATVEEWAIANDIFRNPNREAAARRQLDRMAARGTATALEAFTFEELPTLTSAESARLVPGVLRRIEGSLRDMSTGVSGVDEKLKLEAEWLSSLLAPMRHDLTRLRRAHTPRLGRR